MEDKSQIREEARVEINAAEEICPQAFGIECAEHHGILLNYAYRRLNNMADAEDLVGDTFVRAIRSRHRFEQGTNLRAWLFKILGNLMLNSYKKDRIDEARTAAAPDTTQGSWVSKGENHYEVGRRGGDVQASIQDIRDRLLDRVAHHLHSGSTFTPGDVALVDEIHRLDTADEIAQIVEGWSKKRA